MLSLKISSRAQWFNAGEDDNHLLKSQGLPEPRVASYSPGVRPVLLLIPVACLGLSPARIEEYESQRDKEKALSLGKATHFEVGIDCESHHLLIPTQCTPWPSLSLIAMASWFISLLPPFPPEPSPHQRGRLWSFWNQTSDCDSWPQTLLIPRHTQNKIRTPYNSL